MLPCTATVTDYRPQQNGIEMCTIKAAIRMLVHEQYRIKDRASFRKTETRIVRLRQRVRVCVLVCVSVSVSVCVC